MRTPTQVSEGICEPERHRANQAFLAYDRALLESRRALLACATQHPLTEHTFQQLRQACANEDFALQEYMQALRALHDFWQRTESTNPEWLERLIRRTEEHKSTSPMRPAGNLQHPVSN
jgi:hypothetical protein